jgi:hypothetical protein
MLGKKVKVNKYLLENNAIKIFFLKDDVCRPSNNPARVNPIENVSKI